MRVDSPKTFTPNSPNIQKSNKNSNIFELQIPFYLCLHQHFKKFFLYLALLNRFCNYGFNRSMVQLFDGSI